MRLSASLLFIIFITFKFFSNLDAQSGVIELKEAVRENSEVLPIVIESTNSLILSHSRQVFGLHGGYRVVTTNESVFRFSLELSGTNSVKLSIFQDLENNAVYTSTFKGDDLQHAVCLACDCAVEYTSNGIGFFAGKLSFVVKKHRTSEIYISDLLFTKVRAVTNDRSFAMGPSWSPDGTQLLYTTYHKSGFPDIYLMDLSAGVRQVVANFKGTNNGAQFSPNGSMIAMTLSGSGNAELYVSNQFGRELRRITKNNSLETSPSWSPDGQSIVYASDAPGRPQLFVASATGGAHRRLPTNISRYCAEPDWNPCNSSQITFTAAVNGGFQIALYDAKLQSSKIISNLKGSAVEPTWLNDGRHIILTERLDGRSRLMILDSHSGQIVALHKPSLGDACEASFVY
ncbi:MAG: hypothetical protein MK214_13195 [Thalassotalea sp.]|nr:hypothetical protein [Thalassotalea sp.]